MRANHLYVHVPFCARRCVYCDFAIAVRSNVPVDEYVTALSREWDARHAQTHLALDTVYLGGGTPSKLGGWGVARVLDLIASRSRLNDNAEVTLEANPEDVTPASVMAWRSAGVNRVSLGVQSFDDAVLRWMHRTHDAATAVRAVHVLRDAGIANLSIDLIFAAPVNVDRSWDADLDAALDLALPHLSIYGLTVEEHTPLGRWVASRDTTESPEERFEAEFLGAHRRLTNAGFEHYEVSNYGQPGGHSRHNWAYWRRCAYAGLGPSAHEFDGFTRRWNVAPYVEWARRAGSGQATEEGRETLLAHQRVAEEVYLGLRTSAGLSLTAREREHVASWLAAGWGHMEGDVLRLTPMGWLRLDTLAADLTMLRSRY